MQTPGIDVICINDINPEIHNIAYLLKYDTHYGNLNNELTVEDKKLVLDGKDIHVESLSNISEVDWNGYGCDMVIESSGVHSLLDELPTVIESGISKILVTYSPKEKVDCYLVLGANEENYNNQKHNIISTSICDVVAFAPIYKLIDDNFGINGGFLTTMHPWLSYQNLLDGQPQSWGYPGSLYGHYSLGRSAISNLILKPTTAIDAASQIIPNLIEKMKCYSYRVPTPVVGSADLTFKLDKRTTREEIITKIKNYISLQTNQILTLNSDPLISSDFRSSPFSATVDERWLEIVGGDLLKLTLWYDNEWGYSSKVVEIINFLSNNS